MNKTMTTLAQWTEQTGIKPTTPTTERAAVSVVVGHENCHRPGLWDLKDYKVSSSCGVVVWLVPHVDKPFHVSSDPGAGEGEFATFEEAFQRAKTIKHWGNVNVWLEQKIVATCFPGGRSPWVSSQFRLTC